MLSGAALLGACRRKKGSRITVDIRRRVVRLYARVAGVVLIGVGLLGAANVIGFRSPMNLAHLLAGLMFAYLGFLQRDDTTVRFMVAGMGALLLVGKMVLILSSLLGGEHPLEGPIETTCLMIGLLSLLAVWHSRGGATGR